MIGSFSTILAQKVEAQTFFHQNWILEIMACSHFASSCQNSEKVGIVGSKSNN
jgi:hypothetical protein